MNKLRPTYIAEVVHRYDYFERETVLQYESEVREWGMCATAPEGGGGRNAGIVRERATGASSCDSISVKGCPRGLDHGVQMESQDSTSERSGGD